MADFSALKTSIQNYIKQNGNEEITGNLLQQILLSMVSTLGDSAINDLVTALNNEVLARQNVDGTLQTNINNEATARGNADTELDGRITTLQGVINGIKSNVENGYVYAGIATPTSTPASGKVFYLALTAGTYTNFGATIVPQGINILKYNGSDWSLDSFLGLDDAPTQGSSNLVKSGGVLDSIIKDGSAFDLSAYNNGTTYADLSAALTALNALPAAYKKGGMSMKYVQTSDNKYVQARLMAQSFTTDVTKWQKETSEIKNGSKDLIESGSVATEIGINCFDSATEVGFLNEVGAVNHSLLSGIVTDFIPVKSGDTFSFSGGWGTNAPTLNFICGYSDTDASTFIEGYLPVVVAPYIDSIITVGEGVNYIRAWSDINKTPNLCKTNSIIYRISKDESRIDSIEDTLNGYEFVKQGFYTANGLNSAVEGTICTELIKVNQGDEFYYSGGFQNEDALSLVWGYSDTSYSNAIALVPDSSQIIGKKFIIPNGIEYIGAWSSTSKDYELVKSDSVGGSLMKLKSANPIVVNIIKFNLNSGSFRQLLESITDASENNRYEVQVAEGTYELRSDITEEEISSTFRGINIPNFVKIRGMSGMEKTKFILTLETEHTTISTFNLLSSCELEGLTVEGVRTRYAVHDDQSPNFKGLFYYRNVRNCRFIATDCKMNNAYGAGLRGGARWKFENCIFESNRSEALLIHDNTDFYEQAEVTLINCSANAQSDAKGSMIFRSIASDNENISTRIHLYGCKTKGYSFTVQGSTIYKMVVDGCGNSIDVPFYNPSGYIPEFADLEIGIVRNISGVLKTWNGTSWENL